MLLINLDTSQVHFFVCFGSIDHLPSYSGIDLQDSSQILLSPIYWKASFVEHKLFWAFEFNIAWKIIRVNFLYHIQKLILKVCLITYNTTIILHEMISPSYVCNCTCISRCMHPRWRRKGCIFTNYQVYDICIMSKELVVVHSTPCQGHLWGFVIN